MRKKYISFLILSLFSFTACSNDNGNYVKNLYVSKQDNLYTITFQTYDFSSEEEKFSYDVFSSADIHNCAVSAVSENNYNFRLCENVYISPRMLNSDFDRLFSTINSMKIPPAVNLLCLAGTAETEEIEMDKIISTPLYDFSYDIYGAQGIVAVTDEKGENLGAVVMENGDMVKYLTEKQWKILNMLTGDKSGFSFTVRNDEVYVVFDSCDVYFSDNKIRILLCIKDFKGTGNTDNESEILKLFITNDISEIVYELYNDPVIRNSCKLDRHTSTDNVKPLPEVTVTVF